MKRVFLLLALLSATPIAFGQTRISASEARQHVGEYAKVCGWVASTRFASRSRGAPTFINLDAPYPNQLFTALIWIEDRAKFGRPELRYASKRICVWGVIQTYRGTPEIILRNPDQLENSEE